MTRAVLRCDASPAIGAGHLMRCITLAEALTERGVAASLAVNAEALELAKLPTSIGAFALDAGEQSDAPALARRTGEAELFVIDHYGLGADYERGLKASGTRIVVLEDLPGRPHAADVLIDPTPGREAAAYRSAVPETAVLLLGADYMLLRQEFCAARRRTPPQRATPKVVVAMGGTDPDNATGRVLEILKSIGKAIELVVILGPRAPHRHAAAALVDAWPGTARLAIDPPDMSALLADADVAIGAPGVSASERACLGLPQVLLHTADNQRDVGRALQREGVACDLGPVGQVEPQALLAELEKLLREPQARRSMREAGQALFDGNGAARVAAMLATNARGADGEPVLFRRMKMADEAVTFAWQQDPETRRFAREPRKPSASEHADWVRRRVADTAAVTEILMHRGQPAGTFRLDPRGDALEVSIVIAPECRRRGIGAAALALARALRPRHKLLAHILPANAASRALFVEAGYRQQSDELWVNAPTPSGDIARRQGVR